MYAIVDYILHIDAHLIHFVTLYGHWTYAALFIVIFCETGFIVTPFLPGDSLLFAAGSLASLSNAPLNLYTLFCLLFLASTAGNQLNYMIGRFIGPRVFNAKDSWVFKQKYLRQAHDFYEKNGGKTILLARFIPIIRTFVPFVAGVSGMPRYSYTLYNTLSAVLWIGSLLGLGYFFGRMPIIRDNFSLVICSIIGLSLIPPALTFLYGLCKTNNA